jgi:DNA-directed RNA polymerase subunit RPC12/RpoP
MKKVVCEHCQSELEIRNNQVNFRCPVCRHATVISDGRPIHEACFTHVKENMKETHIDDVCLITLNDETLTEYSVRGFNVFEVRCSEMHIAYIIRKDGETDAAFHYRIWLEWYNSPCFDENISPVYIGIKPEIIDKLQGVKS